MELDLLLLLFYWSIVLDDHWSKKIYRRWLFDLVLHSSLDDLVSFSKTCFNFHFFVDDEILCVYFKQCCIGSLLRGGSWVLRLMSAPAFLGFLPTTNIRHCIHLPPQTPQTAVYCASDLCLYSTPPLPNLYFEVVHCTSTISPPLLVSNFPISPQRTCSALISLLMKQNSTFRAT